MENKYLFVRNNITFLNEKITKKKKNPISKSQRPIIILRYYLKIKWIE